MVAANYLTKGGILRNRAAIFVFASLALGLLVAGCGSSGGDSDSIDKASFVEQANTICKQASGKIAAELRVIGQTEAENPNYTPAVLVKKALIPGLEAEIKELRALGAPPGDKKEVQAFLEAVQKIVNTAEADPETFASANSPYEGAELAARRFGVTECPIAPVESN
jgi:hypothetical protein